MAHLGALMALAILASAAGMRVDVSEQSSLNSVADATKNRPVSKVITVLKDMLAQLEKEGEEDEEIYDQVACWCETNDKEKTKAIGDAEQRITDLTTKIEELTASSSRLTQELKHLKVEVVKAQEALDKATAMRQKELAEFNTEEKDLLQSISALKSAVIVLSKHHAAGSLIQAPMSHIFSVAATLDHELKVHAELLKGVITHSQRKSAAAFVQQTFAQSYAPASGEIFGMLKQMKETFESNLSTTQKEEMANQKAYEDLKAAKEEEIAAAQAQIDTKTQELADTDAKLAQSKQDIEDTRATLSADEQFLMALKEKCATTDQEYAERQKTRQMEMAAVSKALEFLSSDEAHDLFSRTFNPALLQAGARVDAVRRTEAAELLTAAANTLQSPRLAHIVMQIRLDAFTKVKQAIDDMIAQLQKEKADEIKHKDFCVEEFNTNQLQTERKDREKTDLQATIDDLSMSIKALADALEALKSEIADMQVQLKRAGEDREKENNEFQTTVADQRATQQLLQKTLEILKGFYDKAALIAVGRGKEPAGPPPPPGFKAYKKNAASGGVMGMIQKIIDDAKALEAEAIRAEEDAQKMYEDFVKETNASIEANSKDIVNKSEEKAQKETDLVEAEEGMEAAMLELEQLGNYKGQLHQSCDFVLKNFDLRQTARDEEVEALKQAKAILSGAKFSSLLQAMGNQDTTKGDTDLLTVLGDQMLKHAVAVPE